MKRNGKSAPDLARLAEARQSEDSGVTLDDFTVHGLVGEGEFGKVMMVAKTDTGRLYAMKVLRKEHLLFRGSTSITQASLCTRVAGDAGKVSGGRDGRGGEAHTRWPGLVYIHRSAR